MLREGERQRLRERKRKENKWIIMTAVKHEAQMI